MIENGFIKLYRSLINWEWYQDANTFRLFIHLILTVNYEDGNWKGQLVKRGQRITSYERLANELHLSIQNIRTATKHLISTHELTHRGTPRNGVFTVNNYEKYQSLTHNLTGYQQSTNNQLTGYQQATNNKERKQEEKEEKEINTFVQPEVEPVKSRAEIKQENKRLAEALFERLWSKYPRKRGKGQVSISSKLNLLKIGEEQFERCIDRYYRELQANDNLKYLQNGSTFFKSGYIDFLDKGYVGEESAKTASTEDAPIIIDGRVVQCTTYTTSES